MRVVDELGLSRQIIQSAQFDNFSISDRYRELEKRTSVDFSSTLRLLDHLPAFMNGTVHESVRKRMAKQVSSTIQQQLEAGQSEVDRRLDRLLVAGSSFDLVSDLAGPVWRAISAAIVAGEREVIDLIDRLPELFSPVLSIRERIKINAAISHFIDVHFTPDGDEKFLLLCLSALGARPFVGAVGLSLYDVFSRHPSIALRDMAWPDSFSSSALRYVDRIAQTDVALGEEHFTAGERVRCVTQSENYPAEENRRLLFGVGKHTCIGKLTSERMWSYVVERLSRIELRVECAGLTLAEQTDPFTMPATAKVVLR